MTVTKESFLKDVSNHAMTVIADADTTRVLRFMNPKSTDYMFDIVTWGSTLCISGDCGTFVFNRLNDMFTFFRGRNQNLGYWAEKLVATDKTDSHERYSEDRFKAKALEWAEEYADSHGMAEDERSFFMYKIDDDILYDLGDESLDRGKVRDFVWNGDNIFQDFWEVDCKEYTQRFVWNCYAIVWAIEQYDAAAAAQKAGG